MAQENTVSFKVFLRSSEPNEKPEVRRFGIDRDVVSNFSYLSEKLQSVFPTLRSKQFDVSWKDNDGDDVLISTDDELMIALTEMPGDVRKLFVTIKGDHMKDDAFKRSGKQHPGVVCDQCENNINGFRYKCLECINYDLCADCESKSSHPDHFMIRLPVPVSWRPHFGKRLAHHLSKSVRRCNSNASCDDGAATAGQLGDDDCSCSRHGHGHGHGHGGNRWHGHRGGRPMGLMDAIGAIFGGWINEPGAECPTGKAMNGDGEKAKEAEGATANGQTQTSSHASSSKSQDESATATSSSQDEQMRYLKDVGKAVASFLDPLGIDVDVIVERNKTSGKTGDAQSAEQKCRKNVSFADETGNKESETKSEEPVKNEPVASENASERESPEKDDWTVVNGADTSNQESSVPAPSMKKETPAAAPKPQVDAGVGAGAGVGMCGAGAATGAFPKNQGFPVFYPPPPSFPTIPSPFPPFTPPVGAPWPIPPPHAPFPVGGLFPHTPNGGFQQHPKPPQQQQQQQQQQPQQQQPQPGQRSPQHPDPKINQTVESMMSMGFSNEGGWLTQLVEMKNGDIEKVLDLLQPVKRN